MAITTYTTFDTIRTLLGVNAKEVSDATLGLALYEDQFQLELEDVDEGGGAALTEYQRIVGIDAASRSADEARYFALVSILAAYSVARQLLGPDFNLVPKTITDGRASLERRDDQKERMYQAVLAGYDQFLRRLKALLVVLVPSAAVPAAPVRSYISAVGLGTDPVTGS